MQLVPFDSRTLAARTNCWLVGTPAGEGASPRPRRTIATHGAEGTATRGPDSVLRGDLAAENPNKTGRNYDFCPGAKKVCVPRNAKLFANAQRHKLLKTCVRTTKKFVCLKTCNCQGIRQTTPTQTFSPFPVKNQSSRPPDRRPRPPAYSLAIAGKEPAASSMHL